MLAFKKSLSNHLYVKSINYSCFKIELLEKQQAISLVINPYSPGVDFVYDVASGMQ